MNLNRFIKIEWEEVMEVIWNVTMFVLRKFGERLYFYKIYFLFQFSLSTGKIEIENWKNRYNFLTKPTVGSVTFSVTFWGRQQINVLLTKVS